MLNEGISPSTLRVMDALDAEKLDLCRALRIAALSVADCYGLREGRLPAYLRKVPGPLGFRDRIPNVENCRYLVEDTCGLVMWSSIGDLIDVETQITDSIIRLANITQGVNFWAFGRTVDKMGLSGMGVDDIEKYLYEGSLPQ